MQGVVPKLSRTSGRIVTSGEAIGRDNDEVYGGILGLTYPEMAALREKGVV